MVFLFIINIIYFLQKKKVVYYSLLFIYLFHTLYFHQRMALELEHNCCGKNWATTVVV